MNTFPGPATIVANPQVFSCALATGQARLDLRTSTYYSVNSVGSFVWEKLKTPTTVQDLEKAVVEAFSVDAERCHADLQALLNQLAEADLVEIRDVSQA